MAGKPASTATDVMSVVGYLLMPVAVLILDAKHYILGGAVLVLATGLWAGPAAVRAGRRERDRVQESGSGKSPRTMPERQGVEEE
jgi:hypothetical protein